MVKTIIKWVILAFATTMVVIAFTLGGVILSGKHLEVAKWGLKEVLASQGLPVRSIAVTKLNTKNLEISPLYFKGDSLKIEQITAHYSLSSLMEGRLFNLNIQGINLLSNIKEGIVSFPIQKTIPTSTSSESSSLNSLPSSIPIDEIEVNGKVVFQYSTGSMDLPFSISALAKKEGVFTKFEAKTTKVGIEVAGNALLNMHSPSLLSIALDSQLKVAKFVGIPGFSPLPIEGNITGEIGLQSRARLDLKDLKAFVTTGEVDSTLSLSGPTSGKVLGSLSFKSDEQQITIATLPSFTFFGEMEIPTELSQKTPPELRENISEGILQFYVPEPGKQNHLEITLPKSFARAKLSFNQSLTLISPQGLTVKGQARGTAKLVASPPYLKAINTDLVEISLNQLKYNDLKLSLPKFQGSLSGDLNGFSGQLSGQLLASGALSASKKIDQGTLNFSGNYKLTETSFDFLSQDCQTLSIAKGQFDSVIFPKGISLCFKRNEGKALISKFDNTILINALESGTDINVLIKKDREKLKIKGKSPLIQVSGKLNLISHNLEGKLGTQGGQLTLPQHKLRLNGGNLSSSFTSQEGQLRAEAKGRGFMAQSLEKLPLFTPLTLGGSLSLLEDKIRFTSGVKDPSEALNFQAQGTHSLASGKGKLDFTLKPLIFSPDGLQPKSLYPPIGGVLSSVAGQITAQGKVAWPNRPLKSSMSLNIEDMALSTEMARLEGLDLSIDFDSLWPPSAPPGQTLTLALADVGIPVTQLNAVFSITPKGTIEAEVIEWPWAGGSIRTHNAKLGLTSEETRLTMDVEDIDLEEVLPLLNLEGLQGTGILRGKIPIILKPKGASIISGAKLYAANKGVIQYKGQTGAQALGAGGGSAGLLSTALEDFHYKSLEATINGDLTGEMEIGVHLAGHNPSLYDGYPLELNLKLQGGVNQLLKSSSTITDVPTNLRKQLKGSQ
ncbi:MAG: YdbH domain-containing protein [Rhodospirillales bacterium]|nr:YdbH domain-containing protein [Rhodospirillales bacterium]